MAYEILSIGDSEMLYNAFQGAAMIFNDNHLKNIIKSGFIIGLIIICFRYLTNQEFPLRHSLIGIIVYSAMFVPKDTVLIEDVYTGEIRTVANVPLGLAMPMSVVSSMGVDMTNLFEQAFSTPTEASLLEHGYLKSLNTLMKLRNIGAGTYNSSPLVEGDLGKTINSYVENCVMFDLELETGPHEVTRESIQKARDLWAALKTTFINIDVMLTLPNNPNGEQKNCNDAYNAITLYIYDHPFKESLDLHVSGLLGIKDPDQTSLDAIDSASVALGDVIGDSQKFMENALISSYLKDGPRAFIERPAKEQLNLQWASEQSMFNEIEKPLMAFIEVFSVATSPIVAFLCTLGPIGMTMMVRYIQMMLWIALWGPVMAICNLYITISTTRALEVVSSKAEANGSGIEAMIMHDQFYSELEKWLSTGGMLASSAPAISLMLVYGGSIAATNLAGKMTSAASSKINTASTAPDPVSLDSPIKYGSRVELSPNIGAKQSGMADTTYSSSSTFGRASQSAFDSLRSASNTASETLAKINQHSDRSGTMSSQASAITSAMNRTISDGTNYSTMDGRTTSSSEKMSNQESEQVSTAVQGALNAGFSGSGILKQFGASVESQLISNAGMQAARAKELADVANHVVNSGVLGSDITSTTSGSSNTSTNQTFEASEEMQALSQQYQSQLQAVQQASEKYTQTASLQDSAGKSLSMPYQDLGRRLNDSGAIVDIKQAQAKLQTELGEKAYRSLSEDAQYEIRRSSASGLMGGDREALAGFLMLNEKDPAAAARIISDNLLPTNNASGVNFGHDAYARDGAGVDNIVSEKSAGEFRSKAMGDGGEFDGDDASGAGKQSHGGGRSSGDHQIAHDQGHTNKPSHQTGDSKNNGSKTPNRVDGGSSKSKVIGELTGHKVPVMNFDNGGRLTPDDIKGGDLAVRAGKNFGDAGVDIGQDLTKEAGEFGDKFDKALGIPERPGEALTQNIKISVDSLKESLGVDDKRDESFIPAQAAKDDLPPIPK